MTLPAALLFGIVVGMRTMMGPATVSWAAKLGWLDLGGSPLAFLGNLWVTLALTLAAVAELVVDQLPSTPSRTTPGPFAARIVSGGLCGAAVGAANGAAVLGLAAGVIGAGIGTLAGRALRAQLAKAFGRDTPAAFLEDAVAIAAALLIALVLL